MKYAYAYDYWSLFKKLLALNGLLLIIISILMFIREINRFGGG